LDKSEAPLSPLTQEMDPVLTGEVHNISNTSRIINAHFHPPSNHVGSFAHSKSEPMLFNLGNNHAFEFIGTNKQNGQSGLYSQLPDLSMEPSKGGNDETDPFAGLEIGPSSSPPKNILPNVNTSKDPSITLDGVTDFSFISQPSSSSMDTSSFAFMDFNNSISSSQDPLQDLFSSKTLFSNDISLRAPESSSSSVGNDGAFSFIEL